MSELRANHPRTRPVLFSGRPGSNHVAFDGARFHCGSFKTTRPANCDLARACRTVSIEPKSNTSTLATISPANAISNTSCISSAVPTDDPMMRRPDSVSSGKLEADNFQLKRGQQQDSPRTIISKGEIPKLSSTSPTQTIVPPLRSKRSACLYAPAAPAVQITACAP